MKRHMLGSMVLMGALAASAVPGPVQAYPLSPWGTKVPDKTIALTPYLYAGSSDGLWLNPILYAGYGIGDKVDVTVGAGLYTDAAGTGFSGLEIMPRYFLNEQLSASLHFYVSSSAITPAPEIHYAGMFDKFALTINAGYKPVIGFDGTFAPGGAFAYIAPEYYFSKQCSVFVEVNPSFDVASGGLLLTLVPGIWFALDPDQKYSFAVGGNIPVGLTGATGIGSPYLGAWFSTTFGG